MSQKQRTALAGFFDAVRRLKETGVIRSKRYLGDIGEFLCADRFGIQLGQNLREQGYDGHLDGARVQVKYHGGRSTTADLGDPVHYREIFLVLGPDSVLRDDKRSEEFLVYRFSAVEVKGFLTNGGRYLCSKSKIPSQPACGISLAEYGVA